MEHDLNIVNDWLGKQKLKLNLKKTTFMMFYLKHKPINYDSCNTLLIDNELIFRKEECIYLGLNINSQLNWITHINKIKLKIAPIIGVLKRTGKYLTAQVANQIYYAHIHSHLIYLVQIWGAACSSHIEDLQIIQNRAIKALRGLNRLTPTELLYSETILPIRKLIEYEYMLIIYKMKFNLIKYNNQLITNFLITQRSSRTAHHYRPPPFSLSTTQNSVTYKGIKLFNSLPESIKNAGVKEFKSYVKRKLYMDFRIEYKRTHDNLS